MGSDRVLVDTGPLVALLNDGDAAHATCKAVITDLDQPLLSSWAVLAEAAWLLRNTKLGLQSLVRLVAEGVIACPALDESAAAWIGACAERYSDLRPQLADLTLLYLAHAERIDTVFTLDRRDFLVYRNDKDQAFQLLPN